MSKFSNLYQVGIESFGLEHSIRIYSPTERYFTIPSEKDEILLPQNIDAGTSAKWLVQGVLYVSYSDEAKAVDQLAKLIDNKQDASISWEFKFNDGTLVTRNYKIEDYKFDDEVTQKVCSAPN